MTLLAAVCGLLFLRVAVVCVANIACAVQDCCYDDGREDD